MGENDNQIDKSKHMNLLVFSGDYDKALAALIIANGARETGIEVTMFFAFWGLLLLRDPDKMNMEDKSLYEKMFAVATPAEAEDLPLSRMNMAGIGKKMLLQMMEDDNAPNLSAFLEGARNKGVKFRACKLSLEIMGFKVEELLSGVEVMKVQEYINDAMNSGMQLFI